MPEDVHPDYFDGKGRNPMQGASIHHGRKGAKEGRGSMVERLRLITEEVQRCRERIEQDRIRREQRR